MHQSAHDTLFGTRGHSIDAAGEGERWVTTQFPVSNAVAANSIVYMR